ncbi:hypothetical protein PRUPE_7G030400 [Prunus persica]|uniref:Uncharacterized protein n=1 Tax=Prunus persica TaxID=3760 RepID=M5WDF0_PRUPE|nr:hypothetical protein PRUPE_7G030400 [Prunus persica]
MVPTPGMSHNGNSNMMATSSVDASMNTTRGSTSIAPTTVNTGNLLPAGPLHGGSFNRSDVTKSAFFGSMSNGYQQSPASFSIGTGGNKSSMGVQRIIRQMIPTPGFNSSSNQSYMNLEYSNNGGGFSTVDSSMVTQPQQQKQHIGGQISRILHNVGSQMGSEIRSGKQQTSYGLPNGALNGGLGLIGNNLPLVNESGTSEGYMTSTSCANSSKPSQQHCDQHQRPRMQVSSLILNSDSYGMSNVDSFGPGNYYGAATPVGSLLNVQNLNSVSSTPISKTNSPLISNQSNMHGAQQSVHVKPQQLDQLEKISFQTPLSSRENILHSHQPNQFQQQQQLFHQQRQQKQQNPQPQQLLNNDAFGQSQMTSDLNSAKRDMDHHNEATHQQATEPFRLSEMHNQFHQHSVEDRLRNAPHIPSGQHDISSSLSRTSQQMQQILQPHQLVAGSQNDFRSLSVGAQSEPELQGQWHPQSQDGSHRQANMSHEQHVHEDFRQRISGQDEA